MSPIDDLSVRFLEWARSLDEVVSVDPEGMTFVARRDFRDSPPTSPDPAELVHVALDRQQVRRTHLTLVASNPQTSEEDLFSILSVHLEEALDTMRPGFRKLAMRRGGFFAVP